MSVLEPNETRSVFQSWSSEVLAGVPVVALAISAQPDVLDQLREIFNRMKWKLYEARSRREASQVLCSYRMPFILCERSLPDGKWTDILSLVAPLLEQPRVIVLSGPAADSLSSEVHGMGGYGVLAKPLNEAEIIRLLVTASQSRQKAGAAIAKSAA